MVRIRSIDYIKGKIKTLMNFVDKKDVYAVLVVTLVGISSFVLGRLSGIEENRPPVTIIDIGAVNSSVGGPVQAINESNNANNQSINNSASVIEAVKVKPVSVPVTGQEGMYVGSKTSNKYHLPYCPGAQQIKESNKIWFSTKAEAEKAGYVPAANCKGI